MNATETGSPLVIPSLFYIFAALALFYFAYNMRRVTASKLGRSETRELNWREVLPNALLFGLAQRKVSSPRFPFAAVMHGLISWGFLELFFATSVDFFVERGILLEILPTKDTPWFATANELGGLALGVGATMALGRRLSSRRPAILPNAAFVGRGHLFGDVGILLTLILLVGGGFLAEAARLSIEAPATAGASFVAFGISALLPADTWSQIQPLLWWSHAALALTVVALFPLTKLFHSLLALANAGLTNRSEFGQLRPMHIAEMMADPDADFENMWLGAGTIADLTWKQLLDAQTCTECARCTSVCPAHDAGLPLSPMKIMQQIRGQLYEQSAGADAEVLVGAEAITAAELWACTTCGACTDVCPVMIDHIPAIIDMRRFLVLSEGAPPQQAAASLEKTTQQGNPWGFAKDKRLDWTENLDSEVPIMSEQEAVDVLFWVGCAGAYDPRNQSVTKAMIAIFEAADVSYAILGRDERCTGDAARRIGEENVYETLAHENIATLNKHKFGRIVTACPHCMQTLGRDYAQLGGDYDVVHHSAYIDELQSAGLLPPANVDVGEVTFHDPCYLGRHNDQYDAPRNVLRGVIGDSEIIEMEASRESSKCCGAGGGNMWYEMEEGERINLARFDQAAETGAKTIATACSFCLIMMDDANKVRGDSGSIAVKDIAELVAEGLERDG